MPSSSDWYDSNPSFQEFSQGDILRDIPFPRWPTNLSPDKPFAILRPPRVGSLIGRDPKRLPSYWEANVPSGFPDPFGTFEKREWILAECQLRDAIVLSRSCTLDNHKSCTVAPVIYLATLPEEQKTEKKLENLRAGRVLHCFHLPGVEGFDESFADLFNMVPIHRKYLKDTDVKSQLLKRLSSVSVMRLQTQLSEFFGNKFGYGHADSCVTTGIYSCSTCFHSGYEVRKVRFAAGETFGECPGCGLEAKFVKI